MSLHLAVLVPFIFVILIPLLYKFTKNIHTGWIALIAPVSLLIYFLQFFSINKPVEPLMVTLPWISSLGIELTLYLDSLSLLFALLITGIGSLVILYSIFYLSKEREKLPNFYAYLMLFMGAMLGSVLSDNLLVLYTFWELTSVSSFLLIAFWYQRQRSRYGAQKAMFITMTGGFSMLLGFIMLSVAADTLSIRELIAQVDMLSQSSLFLPAMFFILLGAFTKSAQFPFHIWLPDAMEAPTPISAYLHSATMVKAGVYLVARFTPIFGAMMEWSWTIIIVGVITLFWGSFNAVKQFDLKALLAFSTISQLGLIMTLFGIGSLSLNERFVTGELIFHTALIAAVFHLINHSIFKGSLFMMVGILDHETGTRDIRKLGGIIHLMPISFTLTMIGAFSMAGIPLFSGFLSKEMFLTSVLSLTENFSNWTVLIPVVAWIASVLTFVYSMIIIFKSFSGTYHEKLLDHKPHEAPWGMLIPPVVLSFFIIALFIFPGLVVTSIIEPAVREMAPEAFALHPDKHVHISAWHGFNLELVMTLGIFLFGTLLYLSVDKWKTPIFDLISKKWTLNRLYDSLFPTLEKVGEKVTLLYMRKNTTAYLSYIFLFFVGTVLTTLIATGSINLTSEYNSPIEWYEVVLGIITVISAIYVIFATSRLMSIIAISVIGFIIALYFVIFRAPDLALTQLVVETITTALFLLCFYFLPQLKTTVTPMKLKISNLIIALGVGTTMTLIGLSSFNYRGYESISSFFTNSYELAGARNIVNAILVDFRAFDTMLEIVVIFATGIGIYTLIKLRAQKEV